jgi:hypothetical protein
MGKAKVIGAIMVGRGKKRRELKVTEHPFYISKEEKAAPVKRADEDQHPVAGGQESKPTRALRAYFL